jgi:high affinity Mn2+ porin
MKLQDFWGLCAGAVVATAVLPASAADPVTPGSAFYLGGNVGYGFGGASATLSDPGGGAAGGTNQAGALFGGVQAGYEHYLPSRLMLGVELDVAFTSYMDLAQVISSRATANGSANEQLEYLATARGRVGYGVGGWTPFLTGGVAWASTRLSRTDSATGFEDATPGRLRAGYVVGAGIDHALDRSWSARFEYLYTNLGATGFQFNSASRYDSQYDLHRFRVGLNYRFGQGGDDKAAAPDDSGPGSFEMHGQSTFIFQGYPAFSAPYDGPNSLPAAGQARQTWTTSLFLGVRLWQGGEFYFNPELLQGFGVANTTGAGGYPNGEAQKSNFPYPRFNPSRFFLRQEFGLGGETEKVESDYGQLSGTKDVSRLSLQIGKFAVHDLFDTNDYAQDSRVDFLNWSIWASGAFDYAADRVGLTYGATAELNQADWAVRAGYFLMPVVSNGNIADWNLFDRGEYVGELELRFTPFGKPGVAKGGLFLNSGFSGSYNDAVSAAASTGVDPNTAIAQTRQTRIKYGYYLNLQQEITDELGVFGRWSWNDGRTEIMAFTDIDASLALGTSIKGTAWARPDDRVGVAGALNMLSSDHIAFLAAGGLGPLIGDGQLPRYTPEKIIEAYYAAQLFKGFVLTADYQLLIAPAYNADRGPAHVFAGRLRASF